MFQTFWLHLVRYHNETDTSQDNFFCHFCFCFLPRISCLRLIGRVALEFRIVTVISEESTYPFIGAQTTRPTLITTSGFFLILTTAWHTQTHTHTHTHTNTHKHTQTHTNTHTNTQTPFQLLNYLRAKLKIRVSPELSSKSSRKRTDSINESRSIYLTDLWLLNNSNLLSTIDILIFQLLSNNFSWILLIFLIQLFAHCLKRWKYGCLSQSF